MGHFRRILLVFLLVSTALAAAGCQRRQSENDTQAQAKQLFDSACGKCHGSDGRGGVPSAEGQPAPRNFRDAAFQASRTDDDLKNVIRSGKGPMPPFGALFDEAQLGLLVAHIRGFGPKK